MPARSVRFDLMFESFDSTLHIGHLGEIVIGGAIEEVDRSANKAPEDGHHKTGKGDKSGDGFRGRIKTA